MKKPVVDYRQFRLSKINNPQFSHLKLLGWWFLYLVLYFVVGKLVPVERCYMVHSVIDDFIPFCEIFVIPYVLWYFLMFASLVYFAFYDIDDFKKLQKYIIITQFISIAIYIVFPTTQMRPDTFERDNIFTKLVGLLYSVDSNTNVCPSLHVAISIAIASVCVRAKTVRLLWKIVVIISAILISMSTVFIKQHSIIDVFFAVIVCILAELILLPGKHIRKK